MMKKMKLLLLSVLFLFVTGCLKTPEEKVQDALKKTDELKSAHIDAKMNVGIKVENVEMEMPMTFAFDMDTESKISKLDFSVSIFGIKVSSEMYLDARDENNNIIYSKEEDVWLKSVESNNDETSELPTFFSVEEQESTENEYFYKATIAKEEFMKLLEEVEDEGLDTVGYDIISDVTIDVYIDKDTGYVTKMYTDLKNIINYNMEIEEGQFVESEITAFDIEIIFSKFNEVKLSEIPSEVTENAIDA